MIYRDPSCGLPQAHWCKTAFLPGRRNFFEVQFGSCREHLAEALRTPGADKKIGIAFRTPGFAPQGLFPRARHFRVTASQASLFRVTGS
jgi:hypothetical protein